MHLSRKAVIGVAVIALVLAVGVIAPALGGPSLRKLVKREVARQIGKATGPQGAQGIQGIQGIQGPAGPTYAQIEGPMGSTPGPSEGTFLSASVTPPAAGKLLVVASFHDISIDCTGAGPVTVELGLYVDDVAVPATKRFETENAPEPVDIMGVTAASVPAGTHQVQLGVVCQGAPTPDTSITNVDRFLGAVLLGS